MRCTRLWHHVPQALATSVCHFFPPRCDGLHVNRLFCDMATSLLPSAVRRHATYTEKTFAANVTFIDAVQRPTAWQDWPAFLGQFATVPLQDVGRATERLMRVGAAHHASMLHTAWLNGNGTCFPFEYPAPSPASITSGAALRMLYLSFRQSVVAPDAEGTHSLSAAMVLRMSRVVHPVGGVCVSPAEALLWQRLLRVVAAAATLDARVGQLRSAGPAGRQTLKEDIRDTVTALLRPYTLTTADDRSTEHVFELVWCTYEDCSRFSHMARLKVGQHRLWLKLVERLWLPFVRRAQLRGCAADTLVTLYTLDMIQAATASKSMGRDRLLAALGQHVADGAIDAQTSMRGDGAGLMVSRRIDAMLSSQMAQDRVVTPLPNSRLVLRERDGSDNVDQMLLCAEDCLRSFLSDAYDAWEQRTVPDLPPAVVFLKYFRFASSCGNSALVLSVLDCVVPNCIPLTGKMLVQDSIVAASRGAIAPSHLAAILGYASTALLNVNSNTYNRAVLTNAMLQPADGLAQMLPCGEDALLCAWWVMYTGLPEPANHAEAVASHLSSLAGAVEVPLPLGSLRLGTGPLAALSEGIGTLAFATAVYRAALRAMYFAEAHDPALWMEAQCQPALAGTAVEQCRTALVGSAQPLGAEELEWRLFVLLSCALDVELVGAMAMRCQGPLPSSPRLLGLVARMLLELGVTRRQLHGAAASAAIETKVATLMAVDGSILPPPHVAEGIGRLGRNLVAAAAVLPARVVETDACLQALTQPDSARRHDLRPGVVSRTRPAVIFPSIQVDGLTSPQGRRFHQKDVVDALGALSLRGMVRSACAEEAPGCTFSEQVLRRGIV